MNPIDVSFLIHPYTANKSSGAGHDRYAYELLANFPKLGVNAEIVGGKELRKALETLFAELKTVGKLMKSSKNRVFHATATLNAMAPLTARKHPLVTTVHDVLWFFVQSKYDTPLKYWVKSYAIKRAAQQSEALIVPFNSTKKFLMDELKTPENKIHLVEYGVDHQQFYPKRDGELLPRPDYLPENRRNVLFVGAINYGKGIDTLIKCFEQVCKKVPDAHLVIGSKGWDIPSIVEVWEKSPVKAQIHFVGFIPEEQLRSAYIHADLTCFPSRYGFGLSVLESMACGTPTISGRTLDAPEFVEDAGLLIDPDDADDLANAVTAILTDTVLAKNLREKGLQKSARYRWENTAKKTADVYRLLS